MKAGLVFTDPPYNVDYSGRGKKTRRGILNDKMGSGQFDAFLDAAFAAMSVVSEPEAAWYVFHSTSTASQFERALLKAGLEVRNQLIWVKPSASMGWQHYRWRHEPFFYAARSGKGRFYADRSQDTVIEWPPQDEASMRHWLAEEARAAAAGQTTVWQVGRDAVGGYQHPTQKPVRLAEIAMANSTKPGEVALDPFAGSGSTIIAAEKVQRTCHAMELDPHFASTIIRRFERYAGAKAELMKD